jgi:SprT protein
MFPIDYWERAMQVVSAAIRARVTAKIDECAAKINAHYGVTMPPMTVAYDINSVTLGGEAHPSKMHIRCNPVYLNEHTDHYIAQTIPHEVAHLGVHFTEGRSFYTVRTRSGRTKMKRDIHGAAWQAMMRVLGCPADRCHTYTLPEGVAAVGKPKSKYSYRCTKCNATLILGPKKHTQVQAGRAIWHRGCPTGKLEYIASAGKVTYAQARAQQAAAPMVDWKTAPKPAAPTPKAAPAPRAALPKRVGSKLDQCFNWYQHYKALPEYANSLRQVVIAVFVQEVGMTPAGASTYYSKCVQMYNA